jgi:glutathione synthase/RimK-type ligase-like ATP-grasp enzyme
MSPEILLTLNAPNMFRKTDIELLSGAIIEAGFSPRVLNACEMYRESKVPYGALNLSGPPNETHLRYLRKLELEGTNVLNPVYNSIVADDKALSNLEISKLGLEVPKTIDVHLANRDIRVATYVKREIGFPCVLKFPKSGFGVGVHLVKDEKEFEDLFDLLFMCSSRTSDNISNVNLVAQEYVKETTSKDLRVVVLGNECIGAMHRENPIGWNVKRVSWHPLYPETHADIVYTKFQIPDDVRSNCIRICKTLGLGFAGIDILFGEKKFVYGEVNSFPGLKNFNSLYPELALPSRLVNHLLQNKSI